MKEVEARKFLARNVMDARSENLPLRLVDMTGERLKVTAFERETAGTVFIDNTVVLKLRSTGELAYPGCPSDDTIALLLY